MKDTFRISSGDLIIVKRNWFRSIVKTNYGIIKGKIIRTIIKQYIANGQESSNFIMRDDNGNLCERIAIFRANGIDVGCHIFSDADLLRILSTLK